ncbi:MAG: DUF1203 domain-containing protein [Stappiaceae bacterium]
MSFQIQALAAEQFSDLFPLSDNLLAGRSARRMVVDSNPGFPCRISLRDAEIGENVVLVNFEHQPNETPFKAAHAIFVREGVSQAMPAPGEVPDMLSSRLLSIRAFDELHMMIDARTAEGEAVAVCIGELFDDPTVAYIHLHFAAPGCYAAKVLRSYRKGNDIEK